MCSIMLTNLSGKIPCAKHGSQWSHVPVVCLFLYSCVARQFIALFPLEVCLHWTVSGRLYESWIMQFICLCSWNRVNKGDCRPVKGYQSFLTRKHGVEGKRANVCAQSQINFVLFKNYVYISHKYECNSWHSEVAHADLFQLFPWSLCLCARRTAHFRLVLNIFIWFCIKALHTVCLASEQIQIDVLAGRVAIV